ncbi:hypothetical protein QN345_18455 [Cryobacterium sp. 10I1]|nr:hypothetical protein [Cryobacterium sp. 10I1]
MTERSGGTWRPSPGSVYPTLPEPPWMSRVSADPSPRERSAW